MSNPEHHEEILKGLRVMIHGFRNKGVLTCSEMDIINGKLPSDENELFLSFGIDLKIAVTCFPLDPFIPLVKLETKEENDLWSTHIKTEFEDTDNKFEFSPIKKEDDFSHDTHDEDDFFNENLNSENDDEAKKASEKVKNNQDQDHVHPIKVAKKSKVRANNTNSEPISDETEVPTKKRKFKTQFINKDCEECKRLIHSDYKLRTHVVEAHSFEVARGLRAKSKKGEVSFTSQKTLLEKKELYKDRFEIRIPPPEFTKEEYNNCNVPDLMEKCLLTDLPSKMKKDEVSGKLKCSNCLLPVKNFQQLQDHFTMHHRMKFKCPKEGCDFNKRNPEVLLLDFIKHVYFHDNPYPAMNYPHQCLACKYNSPFMDRVEQHIKGNGPFHDNKCPKCEERYSTRQELVDHMKLNGHEGFRCGFCSIILPDENKLTCHKNMCQKRPKDNTICDICGKTYVHMKQHMELHHGEKINQPCPHCGVVFSNETKLSRHINDEHTGNNAITEPCPHCGKCIKRKAMNRHIMYLHTPDHLKPYVCQICKKGFVYKLAFSDHMNIHLGLRPYNCEFCNATFNNHSNKRMHERTTHHGYKRTK